MRVGALLLVATVILLSMSGIAAAADNTAPMPEAGVDQTVPVNSTVYLDGTASRDPDGEIANVSWTIETPSDGTVSPACADCNRTQFNATATGKYTVTLTVTDDDGATRSDTLYVTTVNESGPDVSVAGPTATASGSSATFTANVSAEQAPLQTLTWLVNGSVAERDSLTGSSATVSFTHSFDEAVPVRAVVYDTLGNRGSATQRVSVSRGSSGVGGDGSKDCYLTSCGGTGADSRWTEDDVTVISDTNDKEGLQTYNDEGDLVTIKNPKRNPKINRGNNAEWRIEGGLSSLDDDDFKSDDDETQDSSGFESPTSDVSHSQSTNSIFPDALDSLPFLGGGGSTDNDGSSTDDNGSSTDDNGSSTDDNGSSTDTDNVDNNNDSGGFIGGGLIGL